MNKIYIKKEGVSKYVVVAFFLNLSLLGEKLFNYFFLSSYHLGNYITSIYFILIIICMTFLLPKIHPKGKVRISSQITGLCIGGSAIYLAIYFFTGLITKSISTSPYDLSVTGIIINLITQLPGTIVLIMVGSYSVNTAYKKTSHKIFWIVIITLFLALLQINFSKLLIIGGKKDLFIFIAQEVLPKISLSILISVICLLGGSIPCIWYICIVKIFQFIFPFLPSLSWISESVIGIAYNIILSMFILEEYKVLSHLKPSLKRESIISFSVAMVLLVAFAWFIVGVFPIYPSVILTGSMEPDIYPGDVVIIEKILSEEEVYKLKEGDIINFKIEDITVTHRIEEVILDEAGNLSFITKGDNNDSADKWLVLPNDLKGTVKKVVPKVGLPIVWAHTNENIPEGVIEN